MRPITVPERTATRRGARDIRGERAERVWRGPARRTTGGGMETFPHVQQMAKMLGNLDGWIGKAIDHATAKPFEPEILVHARLAPDQYPFVRQVQAACDAAKFAAARLSGKEPPKNPDTETTLAELRARIAATLAYLGTFAEADFAGAGAAVVPLTWMQGKGLAGPEYLLGLALPNFYFHITTAYAILRHNGVPVGKTDYIGNLTFKDL